LAWRQKVSVHGKYEQNTAGGSSMTDPPSQKWKFHGFGGAPQRFTGGGPLLGGGCSGLGVDG
jgi:hypothetical protein